MRTILPHGVIVMCSGTGLPLPRLYNSKSSGQAASGAHNAFPSLLQLPRAAHPEGIPRSSRTPLMMRPHLFPAPATPSLAPLPTIKTAAFILLILFILLIFRACSPGVGRKAFCPYFAAGKAKAQKVPRSLPSLESDSWVSYFFGSCRMNE